MPTTIHLGTPVGDHIEAERIRTKVGYPAVLKVPSSTRGSGIWKVESAEDYRWFVDEYRTMGGCSDLLAQKCVRDSHLRDHRVVMGHRFLDVVESTTSSPEELSPNIALGGRGRPGQTG